MPNTLGNRVKMSVSGTPGTGTITLGSAVSGFQTFAAAGISNAATVPYVIEDTADAWEIGVGTYTSSGTTLARTSITASSNSGSAISATSSAIVMISPLAADLQSTDTLTSGTLGVARGGTGLSSLTSAAIPYASSASAFAMSGVYWDNANSRFGIGLNNPAFKVEIKTNAYSDGLHIKDSTGTVFGGLFVETTQFAFVTRSNHGFRIGTNDTTRLTISSSGDFTYGDGLNFVFGTTTGTKIGTGTTQKIGFFNATPVAQQSGTGTATGFTAGSGTAVNDASTFTGAVGSTAYRISDIVKALKNLGLLAS